MSPSARISALVLAVSGVAAVVLLAQWVIGKVTDPTAHVDIGETAFVIVAVAFAGVAGVGAAGLALGRRWGRVPSRIAAWLLLLGGVGLFLYAVGLLPVGVAWDGFIGGALGVGCAVIVLRGVPTEARC
jgi:hypothetical protein